MFHIYFPLKPKLKPTPLQPNTFFIGFGLFGFRSNNVLEHLLFNFSLMHQTLVEEQKRQMASLL